MANGGPRVLPTMRQQPGALEQFLGTLQQNLPQTLQQLGQERQGQIEAKQEAELRDYLSQLIQGEQAGDMPQGDQFGMQPQQQARQQQDTTQEMLSSLSQMGVQQPTQTPQDLLAKLQQGTPMQQNLQNVLQQVAPEQMQQLQQQQQQTPMQQEAQQAYQQQQQQLPQMQRAQPDPQTAERQPVLSQEQFTNLYRDLQDQPGQKLQDIDKQLRELKYTNYSEKAKNKLRKELQDEKKELTQEQQNVEKEELPRKNEIQKSMRRAIKANKSLDQLEDISERIDIKRQGVTGQARAVPDALIENVRKIPYLGEFLDFKTLQRPETREFQKIKTDLFDSMKDIFGGNISNQEMTTFLQGLPDAFDQKEVRDKVIDHMRQTNQLMVKRGKIMDQVIQANNGKVPRNIEQIVDRYMGDDIQDTLRQFKDVLGDIRAQ